MNNARDALGGTEWNTSRYTIRCTMKHTRDNTVASSCRSRAETQHARTMASPNPRLSSEQLVRRPERINNILLYRSSRNKWVILETTSVLLCPFACLRRGDSGSRIGLQISVLSRIIGKNGVFDKLRIYINDSFVE